MSPPLIFTLHHEPGPDGNTTIVSFWSHFELIKLQLMAKCGTISIVLSIFTLNWTTNQLLNIANGFRNVADISREEKTWFLGKRWLIGPLLDLGSGGCKWPEVNASSMIFLLKCQLLSTTYSINLINFWVSLDFFTEKEIFLCCSQTILENSLPAAPLSSLLTYFEPNSGGFLWNQPFNSAWFNPYCVKHLKYPHTWSRNDLN